MLQTTRTRISKQVHSLQDATVLPFHDILNATMVQKALAEERGTFHQCLYFYCIRYVLS